MPGYGMKKKPMKHGGKVHRNKKGHGGMMVIKISKDKKNKKYYFTKDTEDAIIEYCSTEETSIRTKLYIEEIQPAFNELVDKIVFTYKFTSLENIDPLKEESKIWLTTILGKFDPSQ